MSTKANVATLTYSSYGYSMDPYFSSTRLSLLDRGFGLRLHTYVVEAEIRASSGMKMVNSLKKNTFTDFIDCDDFLIKKEAMLPRTNCLQMEAVLVASLMWVL
ncbi:MAG: hypothetical protein IPN86_08775 [Saprospiraceae bacterium]|nr:hypothetical protein [Saprospiraceae bacterium]